MHNFRLTLKNYRCFRDEAPVILEIRRGFTALVGPNNSGKSTILRFTHELKDLWQKFFPNSGDLQQVLAGSNLGVTYRDVGDPQEIFCNSNDRKLIFRIELLEIENLGHPTRVISGIIGSADRTTPNNWRIQLLYGPKFKEVETAPVQGGNLTSVTEPNRAVFEWNGQRYDATDVFHLLGELHKCLYIPPFRNAINEGSGTYYGLAVGSSFVELWNNWKTGGSIAQARAVEDVTEDLRSIFAFEKLEINASHDRKELRVTIDSQPFRLAELGSGLAQFIIIFGNVAIKQIPFLVIDEPEINLHPSLQAAFLSALARYASGNIVFATHSIGLARTMAEQIYSFKLGDGRIPAVSHFEQTSNYAEFAGEMSFSAFKELGFESILLVEGVTDVKTYQQFLRKLRNDASVVVIPLGGDAMVCGGREAELAELQRITTNIFALVDSERDANDRPAAKRRQAFEATCKSLGIEVHLTEKRATENYFTSSAVRAVVGDEGASLGDYGKLQDANVGWSKSNHNWQIASHMKREDFEQTDIGQFLLRIFSNEVSR